VYGIKWDGEGKRIKDKARLVGKGYMQQLRIDYNETWAVVTHLKSVRMTAVIAAKQDLKLWRINFIGAYLNSLTKEDIYMQQPESFVELGLEDHVCKLMHVIYGTMQGAHDWYKTLTEAYKKLGSKANPCVRYKWDNTDYTITDTYMDGVLGTSTMDDEIEKRKRGRSGRLRTWGSQNTSLGCEYNKILNWELFNLPNAHTGNMSSTAST